MKRLALCLFAVGLCLATLATPTQATGFPPAGYLPCWEICCPVASPGTNCTHNSQATTCWNFLNQHGC